MPELILTWEELGTPLISTLSADISGESAKATTASALKMSNDQDYLKLWLYFNLWENIKSLLTKEQNNIDWWGN